MSEQEVESNTSVEVVSEIPSDPAALSELVRKQVEYYFSRENLQNDPFLTSQMDYQNSVSIGTVMQFAKLKALTQDEELVKAALVNSKVVSIIDGRIKSSVKPGGRNTIILRDISADTPEEEVRGIFQFESCKPIVSLRSDIENTWFVVLETEQDAKDTILDLKLKKRLFRGESVKARLKSETITRSFYMMSTPPMPPPFGPLGYSPFLPPAGMFPGYINQSPGVVPLPMAPNMGMGMSHPVVPSNGSVPSPVSVEDGETTADAKDRSTTSVTSTQGPAASREKDKRNSSSSGSQGSQGAGGGPHAGKAGGPSGGSSSSSPSSSSAPRDIRDRDRDRDRKSSGYGGSSSSHSHPRGGDAGGKDFKKRAGRGKEEGGAGAGTGSGAHGKEEGGVKSSSTGTSSRTIAVNATNFPPLGHADTTPAPTPGYKGEFIKFSFDAIMNIVKDVRNATLPSTIRPETHPIAMEPTPNLDLLKRQRTFSIDETREQLQQGRPVHREAVLSGAVDYGSMMYGDGYREDASIAAAAAAAAPEASRAMAVPVGKKPASGSWAGVLMSGVTTAPSEAVIGTAKSPAGKKPAGAREKERVAPSRSRDKDAHHGHPMDKKLPHTEGKKEGRKESSSAATSSSGRRSAGGGGGGGKESEGHGAKPKEKESIGAGEGGSVSVAAFVTGDGSVEHTTSTPTTSTTGTTSGTGRKDREEVHKGKKQLKGETLPAASGSKQERERRDKSETLPSTDSEGRRDSSTNKEKSSSAAAPDNWHGRPTFANVLKHAESGGTDLDTSRTNGVVPSNMHVLERKEPHDSSTPANAPTNSLSKSVES